MNRLLRAVLLGLTVLTLVGALAVIFPRHVAAAVYLALVFGFPLTLLALAVIALSILGKGAGELILALLRRARRRK